MTLTQEEMLRYSRHLILPEVGMEGQEKLKQAKLLLVGCGGLGSPLGLYLAAAGVGRLGLVDFDQAEVSNLQRQVVFGTPDIGRPKVEAIRDRLLSLNPNVQISLYPIKLSADNVMDLFKDYDLILDGTDNFPTRYLINDACILLRKPNVYGSIFRFEGQATIFGAARGPCYRCLFPEPPPPHTVPSCAEAGVLGILPGMIGLIQATEAIKLILGKGKPLIGRLLLYNALDMKFREIPIQKDPECPVCGTHPTITKPIADEQGTGRDQHACADERPVEISARELKQKIDRGDGLAIIDVREPREYQINRIPGSRLIPLGDMIKKGHELDKTLETIVYCRSGTRSARAIEVLQKMGFTQLRNLRGGILAWSKEVDPTVPKD